MTSVRLSSFAAHSRSCTRPRLTSQRNRALASRARLLAHIARSLDAFTSSGRVVLSIALLVVWIGLASEVRADVAVIVPPHVEQGAAVELGEQAVEELTRLLKVQGFDVISAGQAGPTAEAQQQRGSFPTSYDPLYCLTPECASEYRKLFDATFAVQLTLFGKGVRTSSLSIVLTEQPKIFFGGSAPVEGRDVRSAVRAAFETARGKQIEGAGPWLTVEGTPERALVYVDGMEYGRVPFSKRHIEAGPHRLEIRAEGRVTQIRNIDVGTDIDHEERVSVQLVEGHGEHGASEPLRAPSTQARFRRSAWDWVLGSAIAVTGLAHLSAGLYQKAREGDCAERHSGVCTERYGDERGLARDNLLIGLGAAGVGLGVLVMAVGPIGRLQVRAGVDHAALQWTREF